MLTIRNSMLLAALIVAGLATSTHAQSRGFQNRNTRARTPQNRPAPTGARANQQFPKADLTLDSLQFKGNVVSAVVRNKGGIQAPASQVRIELRSTANGQVVKTQTTRVSAIAPGKTSNVRFHGLPLDNVKVIVTADVGGAVGESNEGNNRAVLNIGQQRQNVPDLVVTQIRFDATNKIVWAVVRNVGPGKLTGKTSLQLQSYFGPGNRVERKSQRVGPLNPGTQTNIPFNVQQMNIGMQFEAIVDRQNDLPEQNERNNRKTVTYN